MDKKNLIDGIVVIAVGVSAFHAGKYAQHRIIHKRVLTAFPLLTKAVTGVIDKAHEGTQDKDEIIEDFLVDLAFIEQIL